MSCADCTKSEPSEPRESLENQHSDPESWAAPSPHIACDLKGTEEKYFEVGEVVKVHSYRTIIHSTINQDETIARWALTVAYGEVYILFFLQSCFSMNQNHTSPPP